MVNLGRIGVAFCLAIGSLSCDAATNGQASGSKPAISSESPTSLEGLASQDLQKLRATGELRGRAPADWTQFNWPEKRRVLFEFYGPSEAEKLFVREAVPQQPQVVPNKKRRLLVFYRCQYPHASIATANYAYEQLAKATGAFEAVLTDDPSDIRSEYLADFDALLLNNTTDFEKTIGAEGQQALLDFVRSGKGLVGVHAAADSCKSWPEGSRLLNGVFRCHPWLPSGTWAFQLDAPHHLLNEPFYSKGFWLRDEVYVYRDGTHVPEQSLHLVSLDLSKRENHESPDLRDELRQMAYAASHRPVAWIHRFGNGRVFYSNLGHNNTTYWNPTVLEHYLAGIQYALGDLEADASPTPIDSTNVAPAADRTK